MRKVKAGKQFGRRVKRNANGVSKFEVAKLELHRGDILVLRTDLFLTRDQVKELRKRAVQHFPKGIRIAILTAGLSLAVLQDKRAKS